MGGLGSRSSRGVALTHLHSIAAHIGFDEDLQPMQLLHQLSGMQPCPSQNSSIRGWHFGCTRRVSLSCLSASVLSSLTMISSTAGNARVYCKWLQRMATVVQALTGDHERSKVHAAQLLQHISAVPAAVPCLEQAVPAFVGLLKVGPFAVDLCHPAVSFCPACTESALQPDCCRLPAVAAACCTAGGVSSD